MQRRQQSVLPRRRRWTLTATIEQNDDPDDDILGALLDAARMELLVQSAGEASLDGQTMGILAFNGALLAADLAARDLLGRWWWTPLVALGLSTLVCLWSLLIRDTDCGSPALKSYSHHGSWPSFAAKERLLGDLAGAYEGRAGRLEHKATRLRWTLGILIIGLVAAALMIALGGP